MNLHVEEDSGSRLSVSRGLSREDFWPGRDEKESEFRKFPETADEGGQEGKAGGGHPAGGR